MGIKIAICDDEQSICSQLEKMIIRLLKQMNVKHEIDTFITGESLCREENRQKFDLIFLEIELPDMNGIEVGRYIRECEKNEIVQIAYISEKTEYAMELFEFRPINFLVKPLEEEQVKKVLEKYMIIMEQDSRVFEYGKRREFYKVPVTEILYFKRNGRKITIHMISGTDEFYDSIENVYDKLKRYDFLLIHQSTIVNYRFIKKISYEKVIMIDNMHFPISQPRRSAIKSMYMNIRKREL